MQRRMTIAFLLLSTASCSKSQRIDPVSIEGIGGCGTSDFMYPLLVRLSGEDGKSEILIPRQQNTRAGIQGDKETSWDVEVFQCANMYEATSEWECEVPVAPYHKSTFDYDPSSPTKISIVPPTQGIQCREEVPVNVQM